MSKWGVSIRTGMSERHVSSWTATACLVVLLPVLEWGAPRVLRATGMAMSTSTTWGAIAIADLMFIALLPVAPGRVLRQAWTFPTIKDLGLIVGAFVAGWVVIPMVQFLAAPLAASLGERTGPSLEPSTGLDVVVLAIASVAGALAQESLYRGIVWSRVKELSGNDWVAAAVSSLLFGTLYAGGAMVGFLSAGVAWGLVAGILYKVTKSLTCVIVLNAMNVFLTYAVLLRYII